jgi:hypothetical protein
MDASTKSVSLGLNEAAARDARLTGNAERLHPEESDARTMTSPATLRPRMRRDSWTCCRSRNWNSDRRPTARNDARGQGLQIPSGTVNPAGATGSMQSSVGHGAQAHDLCALGGWLRVPSALRPARRTCSRPVGLRRLSMSDWRLARGKAGNSGSARAAIEDLEGTSLTRLWRGARPASATTCDLLREHDKQDDHRGYRRDGEHDRNRQLHHPLDGGLAYEGRRAAGDDGRPSNPFRGLEIGC